METLQNGNAAVKRSPDLLESIQSRYFKMGAVVALGELLHEGEIVRTETQRIQMKRYLASFGIKSIEDVERLGIQGIYKYSFERLYS